MHTHFGSATHLAATFIPIAIFGTFWRLGWIHAMAIGHKRGMKHLSGFARAALFQY